MPKNNTSSFIPRTPQEQPQFNQVVSFALVALVVGAIGGFLSSQVFFKPAPKIETRTEYVTEYISEESGEKFIKEEELQIVSDILKNPLIIDWRVGVEGNLAAKTDTTFTLESKGHFLYLTLLKNNQTDFVKFLEDGTFENVVLENIPLGTFLSGSAQLIPKASGETFLGGSDDVLAERFRVFPLYSQ